MRKLSPVAGKTGSNIEHHTKQYCIDPALRTTCHVNLRFLIEGILLPCVMICQIHLNYRLPIDRK